MVASKPFKVLSCFVYDWTYYPLKRGQIEDTMKGKMSPKPVRSKSAKKKSSAASSVAAPSAAAVSVAAPSAAADSVAAPSAAAASSVIAPSAASSSDAAAASSDVDTSSQDDIDFVYPSHRLDYRYVIN